MRGSHLSSTVACGTHLSSTAVCCSHLSSTVACCSHLSSTVVCCSHLSSTVVCGTHLSSTVACCSHLSSTVVCCSHLSSTVVCDTHLSSTLVCCSHLSSTVVCGTHLSSTVVCGSHLFTFSHLLIYITINYHATNALLLAIFTVKVLDCFLMNTLLHHSRVHHNISAVFEVEAGRFILHNVNFLNCIEHCMKLCKLYNIIYVFKNYLNLYCINVAFFRPAVHFTIRLSEPHGRRLFFCNTPNGHFGTN